jgi:hypothetical protein
MFGLPKVIGELTAGEEILLQKVVFKIGGELDVFGPEGVGHEGFDGGGVGGGVEDHVLVRCFLLDAHLVGKALAEWRETVLVVDVEFGEVIGGVGLQLGALEEQPEGQHKVLHLHVHVVVFVQVQKVEGDFVHVHALLFISRGRLDLDF